MFCLLKDMPINAKSTFECSIIPIKVDRKSIIINKVDTLTVQKNISIFRNWPAVRLEEKQPIPCTVQPVLPLTNSLH